MEETKAQPVLEVGQVETQKLLPKTVGEAGVIIYIIYIYIYIIGATHGRN